MFDLHNKYDLKGIMDLKFFIILTFVVDHAISYCNVLPTENMDDQKPCKVKISRSDTPCEVFSCIPVGEMIAEKVSVMSESANSVLNRRARILHYHDGKITPPYLVNAFLRISQKNFTIHQHAIDFADNHWSPHHIILFGVENPLNIMGLSKYCHVLIVNSQKDHLKMFDGLDDTDTSLTPDEIRGSPMNGVIIPWNQPPNIHLGSISIRNIELDIVRIFNEHIWLLPCLSLTYDQSRSSGLFATNLQNKNSELLGLNKSGCDALKQHVIKHKLKLAIVISSDDMVTGERAEGRALRTVQALRNVSDDALICVVAQSDIRENAKCFRIKSIGQYLDGLVLTFQGSDMHASTFVVDTRDEKTLKTKFEDWKKKLNVSNSHQAIAFHFTVVNGTEPKNSEQIFSTTFPDIPLSTLRLLGGPSTTGVNYQVRRKSHFNSGPIYIIVEFRKFGY
uniref:VWFA domain-containing protein n=1 Tax=Elaeophora elaphi TaxID=1147741 RepID=A0A0R3RIU3_9BILA